MTPAQRITLSLAATLAALLFAVWLWRSGARSSAPPASTATPTSLPEPPTPTPTLPAAPPGYRLAGVAIGGATSYAAIEPPGGNTSLYRLNAEVPGLGRIVRIDGERVLVRTAGGDFEMWVAPAPTPTFSVTRRLTPRITPTRVPSPPESALPSPGSSP